MGLVQYYHNRIYNWWIDLRPTLSSRKPFIKAPPGVNSPRADTEAAGLINDVAGCLDNVFPLTQLAASRFNRLSAVWRSSVVSLQPLPAIGPCKYLSTWVKFNGVPRAAPVFSLASKSLYWIFSCILRCNFNYKFIKSKTLIIIFIR